MDLPGLDYLYESGLRPLLSEQASRIQKSNCVSGQIQFGLGHKFSHIDLPPQVSTLFDFYLRFHLYSRHAIKTRLRVRTNSAWTESQQPHQN